MRELRIKEIEFAEETVSSIVTELDRIGRNREQTRHNNSFGFMYIAFMKKINQTTFEVHLSGPDTDKTRNRIPLSVEFIVTQNEYGIEQITIGPRDGSTTYEQAMLLAKHATNKFAKELPKKPYKFEDGLNKDNWDGYYFSYSGTDNKIREDFDEFFTRAVAEGYISESLRETCREYGFNIKPEPWNRGLSKTEFPQNVLEQIQL